MADKFFFTDDFRIECAKRFVLFANRGGTGINLPTVIESPFCFAGRTGIKQGFRQLSVLSKEFRYRVSRFMKLKDMRVLLYKVVNIFVKGYPAEQLF